MRVNHTSQVARLERELFLSLCESIGTPRALTASLLLRDNQYKELLDLSIDASNYSDHRSFSDDLLVTSVLSKNPRLPLDVDRREVAVRKFLSAEVACKETNARIAKFREDPKSWGLSITRLIPRVQSIIERILHSHPSRSDLRYCENNMRFGPGATTSCSGIVTQGRKFSNRNIDTTAELVSFRAFCFPDIWKENVKDLTIRDSSKLTTVPKNAKTDRVICIEPDLNIFVQLGIGALIRKKLANFGLDLNTQEGNQRMAARAYADSLATVDLASASDTISFEVVNLLLPPSWVELLLLPRVGSTTMPDGTKVNLQKWSSMGNGYTFELETLIFYAVALAVTDIDQWNDVIAYGDDIILPAEYVPNLSEALDFLGFKVNHEKTFGKGSFYESCGTDWFKGKNVRPFFFRSDHHDFPTICYLYANNARRWAHRRNGGGSCDARVLPLWLRCFTAVKPAHRHHIPEGYGDVGFASDFDRACPFVNSRARRRTSWGGYFFRYRGISMRETRQFSHGMYISSLRGGNSSQWTLGNESLRGRPMEARRKLGYSLEWPNLGPWL